MAHVLGDFCEKSSAATGPISGVTKGQISGIENGQIVTVSDAPLMTSVASPWAGFLLETYESSRIRHAARWGWHRTHVCLIVRGEIRFRVHWGSSGEDFAGKAGSICIFPSGFSETHIAYDESPFQAICLELDPSRLAALLGRRNPVAIRHQLCVEDPHVAALLTNMQAEIADGCPSGDLYGESLSLALAAYVEGRFADTKQQRKPVIERRFREEQARRLVEYIRTNLAEDLTLGEMADVVDMSPRQFFRLFSSTFESTPHRFVVNERISRAKELLAAGLSLVEIAHTLGFASQSHFTNVFSKITGLSPGRFRQETGSHSKRGLALVMDDDCPTAFSFARAGCRRQEPGNA
jgi:AraC family transcriptional regulator